MRLSVERRWDSRSSLRSANTSTGRADHIGPAHYPHPVWDEAVRWGGLAEAIAQAVQDQMSLRRQGSHATEAAGSTGMEEGECVAKVELPGAGDGGGAGRGSVVEVELEAGVTLGDLLTRLAYRERLTPVSEWALCVGTERPPGFRLFPPSTPVAALPSAHLRLVPKDSVLQRRPAKAPQRPPNQPFTRTERVEVEGGSGRRVVVRVDPESEAGPADVLAGACHQLSLDPRLFHLAPAAAKGLPVPLGRPISTLGTRHFALVPVAPKATTPSRAPVAAPPAAMPPGRGSGLFGLLKTKKKTAAPSVASSQGQVPPLASPPAGEAVVGGDRAPSSVGAPPSLAPPSVAGGAGRKKRAAPPPPAQPPLAVLPKAEPAAPTAGDKERQSSASDSSGYHDSRLDSPPAFDLREQIAYEERSAQQPRRRVGPWKKQPKRGAPAPPVSTAQPPAPPPPPSQPAHQTPPRPAAQPAADEAEEGAAEATAPQELPTAATAAPAEAPPPSPPSQRLSQLALDTTLEEGKESSLGTESPAKLASPPLETDLDQELAVCEARAEELERSASPEPTQELFVHTWSTVQDAQIAQPPPTQDPPTAEERPESPEAKAEMPFVTSTSVRLQSSSTQGSRVSSESTAQLSSSARPARPKSPGPAPTFTRVHTTASTYSYESSTAVRRESEGLAGLGEARGRTQTTPRGSVSTGTGSSAHASPRPSSAHSSLEDAEPQSPQLTQALHSLQRLYQEWEEKKRRRDSAIAAGQPLPRHQTLDFQALQEALVAQHLHIKELMAQHSSPGSPNRLAHITNVVDSIRVEKGKGKRASLNDAGLRSPDPGAKPPASPGPTLRRVSAPHSPPSLSYSQWKAPAPSAQPAPPRAKPPPAQPPPTQAPRTVYTARFADPPVQQSRFVTHASPPTPSPVAETVKTRVMGRAVHRSPSPRRPSETPPSWARPRSPSPAADGCPRSSLNAVRLSPSQQRKMEVLSGARRPSGADEAVEEPERGRFSIPRLRPTSQLLVSPASPAPTIFSSNGASPLRRATSPAPPAYTPPAAKPSGETAPWRSGLPRAASPQRRPSQPAPPPPPPPTSSELVNLMSQVKLKKTEGGGSGVGGRGSAARAAESEAPRSDLLAAIRDFGGSKGLKTSQA